MPIQQQLHAAWAPVLTDCKHVIKGYPNHLNHQTRVLASATFWSTWQVAGWFKATKNFSHWVKMLNVEWHTKGCCTWTNVKKWANETSFHKANGYEWSSPSPVQCWTLTWCSTLTTLAYFDPTVTASHKIWHLNLCCCTLHPAKCCNLFPLETSKKGSAISAVIDPASVVEGQKHSNALSSALETQGIAHTWTAVCIIPMPRFFWCM